ncbi:MAG TPA: putative metal-binding motif-containing protein, partial [Polyangiaceae bacterium]
MRRALVLSVLVVGCARTGLLEGDADGSAGSGGSTFPECRTSADCVVADPCVPPRCIELDVEGELQFRCVPEPVICDDLDECTLDRCEPATGLCRHERPADADGDGYLALPPPEIPARCGVWDCDDADASVRPGAGEVCDGRDNDCNDAIDEGFDYTSVEAAPVPIAPIERGRATRGGLAWNGSAYGVTYNTTGRKQSYFKLLTASGFDASAEVEVSHIN